MEHKKSDFLVILLSSLLIISCLVAGFFAWKTQNLVKEITNLKLVPTPTATATATPDPTVDWKTYTNTKYKFSVKYPNGLVTDIKEVDIKSDQQDYIRKCQNDTNAGCGGSAWPDYKITFYRSNGIAAFDVNVWNIDYTEQFGGKFQNNKTFLVSTFRLVDENGKIEPIDESLLKSISDTLEFTDQIACTTEAKICPDGSAVGRSGPKCEFAPCPTSKP